MPHAVLTRDEASAAPYIRVLAPFHYEAIAMPVTSVEPPRDTRALSRALAAGPAIAVLASARGATALAAALGEHAGALPTLWAVGPATARALDAVGLPAHMPSAARDGATLAHAICAAHDVRGMRVLVPRAEDGRDDAIAILRAAGAIVDDVIAYRTVAVAPPHDHPGRAALQEDDAICVVFAPSQVAALDAHVGLATIRAAFVAIGDTTARALRAAGATVRAVAESPTPAGIAKAIGAVYPVTP